MNCKHCGAEIEKGEYKCKYCGCDYEDIKTIWCLKEHYTSTTKDSLLCNRIGNIITFK